MAYKRIVTQDGVTVMNKDLYDNLQDGIDESKQAVQDLEDSVEESFKEVDTKLQDSGGIKFDGERDMIMIKNPFTGEWIDWQSSGKIILPSTITITTNTLGGKQVTCLIGGKTYTSEFSIISGTQGVAVFTVYEDGEAVITCESYTTSVTIQEKGGGTYSLNLEEVTELLLWDGENFHNGAEWYNGPIWGIRLETNDLQNKKFIIQTGSSTISNVNFELFLYKGPNGFITYFAEGKYSTSEITNVQVWSNTRYEISIEKCVELKGVTSDGLTSFLLGMTDEVDLRRYVTSVSLV
jgi:hypothetical protein